MCLSFVAIYKIRNFLKRKKTNSKRQHNLEKVQLSTSKFIYILNKKITVFKKSK